MNSTGFSKERTSEQKCFDEIERMWIILGRQPTRSDIIKRKISRYSLDTFKRRFGGWRKALEAFVGYINSEQLEEVFPKIENNNNLVESISIIENNNVKIDIPKPIKTSRTINDKLRFKVLKRDNFKCCVCGASPAKDPSVSLHIDHIIPWSKGGETIEENL